MLSCCFIVIFFFFKQKTAYEMRISDWSSDVCSSDLMAIVMPEEMTTAVLDVDQTAAGNVAFGEGNSWYGDQFDKELRQAVAEYERARTALPVPTHDAPDLEM